MRHLLPLLLLGIITAGFAQGPAKVPKGEPTNAKGYDFLGETVAKAIEAQLPKR